MLTRLAATRSPIEIEPKISEKISPKKSLESPVKISDSGVKLILQKSTSLKYFRLNGCSNLEMKFADDWNKYIPSKVRIDINGCYKIKNKRLSPFLDTYFSRLVKVFLVNLQISDPLLVIFGKNLSGHIKEFHLERCAQITYGCFSQFQFPSSLRTFELTDCSGIKQIDVPLWPKCLRSLILKKLNLEDMPRKIIHSKTLKRLIFSRIKFSSSRYFDFKYLFDSLNYPRLEGIDISENNYINVATISLIAKTFDRLKALNISFCMQLNDQRAIQPLNVLYNEGVEDLNATGIGFSEEELKKISMFREHRAVHLARCADFSDDQLRNYLLDPKPGINFVRINLSHCTAITADGIRAIVNCSQSALMYLNLSYTKIDGESVKLFRDLPYTLKELNLSHCKDIPPKAFRLLWKMPSIQGQFISMSVSDARQESGIRGLGERTIGNRVYRIYLYWQQGQGGGSHQVTAL